MNRAYLLLFSALAGCESTPIPSLPASALRQGKLLPTSEMSIVPTVPVSRDDAFRIAGQYFHTFFGDCGGVGGPTEADEAWLFSTAVGFAGAKGPTIVVAKSGLCVFARGKAPIFWIDGRWRFDATRYRTFFSNNDVEGHTPKG
jgi:hypothetical protein